jgi:NAD(P)-dependent dehydrogenase (short-subunit alcohol dehydrogenase family)
MKPSRDISHPNDEQILGDNMPDKKIILITGATDGIGKQTALELIQKGAQVIIHGRSAKKAQATQEELRDLTKSDYIEAIHADLASLQESRAALQQIKHPRIDVLINNAGTYKKERELTPDGFELTMAANHFGHFVLTHALLPLLRQSPQGRIINLSSIAHSRGTIDLNDLFFSRNFDGYSAYASSKLANILFTYALARRLSKTSITVNALHPGVISTKLLTQAFSMSGGGLAQGAATSVLLATDPSLSKTTGKYFSDRRETPSSQISHNQDLQEKFYALSCKLTGVEAL